MDLDLAREHDLLKLPRPNPLHGPRHGLFEMGRGHRARDLVAAGGRGIDERQWLSAQVSQAPVAASQHIGLGVVRRHLER